MNSQQVKRIFSAVLKIAVSAGAIFYVFTQIDTDAMLDMFRESSVFHVVVGMAVLILSQLISADRLRVILRSSDVIPDRVWNYKLYFVGMAYNLFLPGGIGGDAYKAVVYNRRFNIKKRIVGLYLIIDRLSGLEMILVWLSFCAFYLDLPLPGKTLYWLVIPGSIAVIWLLIRKFLPSLLNQLDKILFLAFLVQSVQIICIQFLAKGLGFEADFIQITAIFLISTLATTIPVFMGGIGAREAVFGLLALDWGLDESAAVAVGLAFSAITIVSSLPGLYFDWTLKRRQVVPKDPEEYANG